MSRRGPHPRPAKRAYRLNFGRVFEQSFRILFRHGLPFLVFALLLHLPLTIYAIDVHHDVWQGGPSAVEALARFNGVQILGSALAALLLQIVIAYGVYAALLGKPAGFGASLGGLRRFFPALGVSFLVALLAYVLPFLPMVLATAFLVGIDSSALLLVLVFGIGGLITTIIVTCIYFVAVQATIVEYTGVIASMRRSAALTRGSRSIIFALLLVVGIAGSFLKLVPQNLFFADPKTWNVQLTSLLVDHGITAVTVTFQAILAAVTYCEFRRGKEGVDIEGIVKVFE